MKITASILLIISMLIGLLPANTSASSAKDGYTLVPLMYGTTGVDTSSPFKLTTPVAATSDELAAMLTIDGQPAPAIEQKSKTEFHITPTAALFPNSLYIFRLKRDGREDITWAFQTAKKFQITSSFPRNESTNVPRRSGIEITFSSDGYSKIDAYFDISPNVSGKFEYHKETAVFVPKILEYKTIYTVTLRAGVKLDGTNEALKEDYVFAFETEPEPTYAPPKINEYTVFNTSYTELPSTEAPNIGFWIHHDRLVLAPNPKIDVYRFETADKAVEAAIKIGGAPSWSRYAVEDSLIETSSLYKVMTFNASGHYDDDREILSLPDRLPQGFYLLEATLGQSRSQMILQISDLPIQVVSDAGKTIVWVNDITTGKASAGAEVLDVLEGKTYKTDPNGVAVIGRALNATPDERLDVKAADGKQSIWLYSTYYGYYPYGSYGRYSSSYYGAQSNEEYWTVLQLDRTLFKRDDAVSYYGFVQRRKGVENISNVTAVITLGYRYGYYGTRDILFKQTTPIKNGAYSDEINLPNLDPGSYCLTIFHGDITLGNTYFEVQDYVKPPYKIDISVDKKAAFAGETVTYTATAGFFEGTPVSDLEVSYNLWARSLKTSGSSQAKTDIDGNVEVSQKIEPTSDAQGQTQLYFNVEATLPEIGLTIKGAQTRVFINDIEVSPNAKRKGKEATLSVEVNSITLDRLNDGTAENYYDYIDMPVAGKTLSVIIYRVYYEKILQGEYYDYIEKKNVPRYIYERREEEIEKFSLLTDNGGKAERNFTIPDRQYESYYALITCEDGNGRSIKETRYIGRDYSYYYKYAGQNDYFIDGAEDFYSVGDEVNLTLMRGAEPVERGNYLFIATQSGIQGWQAGKNPYRIFFSSAFIPNVTIDVYYFNGYNYVHNYNMSTNIRYDYMRNDLVMEVATDKESYKPGEMCTINIKTTGKDGNAVPANVNISVVDEALFALRDYDVNTLLALYRTLSSGIIFTSATHKFYISESDDMALNYMSASGGDGMIAEAPMAMMADRDASDESGGASGTYLRELFKDTAFFYTVRTNDMGAAAYSFKLPDNITSWRLTTSGVSNDLFAGNNVRNIIVTNPMFINYSLNDEFLVGDKPVIGVNAYGTSLSGGEVVEFEVWDEAAPDKKYTASGKPFERINIPLWEMGGENAGAGVGAGAGALIIKASVSNGASDAIKHQYQVLDTYMEIDSSEYYDVTKETVFSVGSGGLTRITFTDRSRGVFLNQLLGMRYVYGDRVEKLIVRKEANKLLAEYFPDLDLYCAKENFDFLKYQRDDGGISILPHADSDLETTVKLMPFIMDDANSYSLKNYLYGKYEGENADNKMCALYGLAMLHEPVLLDLDNYSQLDGLSVKDIVYIALGYCALGETEKASILYDGRIAPRLEKLPPYYRVNTGVDNDDILSATSAANLLAIKLDKPEKEGLYEYCIRNYTTDIIINIEKLSYIQHEIGKKTEISGTITYSMFGEESTRELINGRSFTLRIPARSIDEFKLLDVKGDVGAVSTYKKPLTEISAKDNEIKITRRYYKSNEIDIYSGSILGSGLSSSVYEQGDLVRVQLWIDYSAKAIDGSYCVTDYLPSGLAYVDNSAKIDGSSGSFGYGYYRYCTVEGQKITFYDYNGRFTKGYLYYYYARVVNPGEFKAEGTLVQNLNAPDYYTVGEDAFITIT